MKITGVSLSKLKPTTKPYRIWDDLITGFGIRVFPSGRKSFLFRYSTGRRRREYVLGDMETMTLSVAHGRACQLRNDLSQSGADPLTEKQKRKIIPTFAEFRAEYLAEVTLRKKAPGNDRHLLIKRTPPSWDHVALPEITVEMISRHFDLIAASQKPTANRWRDSIASLLQSAWRREIITDNPARRVRALPENPPRTRTLSDDEMTRLHQAIAALSNVYNRVLFTLLISTGCRVSELLKAKWEDIDFDQSLWRLPVTKAGKPQLIPLSIEMCELLRALPRKSCYVIPGRDGFKHRWPPQYIWGQLCKIAGLRGVTIHDIRRSAGLFWARQAGLHIAAKLLRHSNINITERVYAPLTIDSLREAVAARQKVLPFSKAT